VAARARAFYMRGPMSDTRLKKLSYRAWRRGIRETDLILGPFADAYLHSLTPAQLDAFEALLDLPDQDLYDWYKGVLAPPPIDADVLAMIRAFRPSDGPTRGA
jgi:antitoxin CptB